MDKEKLMTEEEWLDKYNASQKKSKKKNVRKWVRNGVALGLVAVLSVAGTLAYLQKQSNEKTNTFTGSPGLRLSLTESNWDTDNDKTADDGEPMKEAASYIPGNTYKKNPQLINWTVTEGNTTDWGKVQKETSGDVKTSGAINDSATDYTYSEYVALQVELSDNNGDELTYDKLTNVIDDIVFDSSKWVLIAYYEDSRWTSLVSNAANYFKTTPTADIGKLDIGTTSDLSSATKFVFAYATVVNVSSSNVYQYTEVAAKNATEPLFSQIKINQDVYDFSSNTGVEVTDPSQYPEFNIKLSGGAVDTKTYGSATGDNQKAQIGTDLLKVLDAVNP